MFTMVAMAVLTLVLMAGGILAEVLRKPEIKNRK